MTILYFCECDHCGFKLEGFDWGQSYITEADGKRVYWVNGFQGRKIITEILGENPAAETIAARVSFERLCLCLNCWKTFGRDIDTLLFGKEMHPGRDRPECPYCHSAQMKPLLEFVNQPCPRCQQGIFREFDSLAVSILIT